MEIVGYDFNPDEVNASYDRIVIPAANWISPWTDLGALADALDEVEVPIVVVGIGAQSGIEMSIPDLKPGTARLLKVLSGKGGVCFNERQLYLQSIKTLRFNKGYANRLSFNVPF